MGGGGGGVGHEGGVSVHLHGDGGGVSEEGFSVIQVAMADGLPAGPRG